MLLPGVSARHTRGGAGSRNRLYAEKYAPTADDFIVTENGLWQLPPLAAQLDRDRGVTDLVERAHRLEAAGSREQADIAFKGARILGRSAIDKSGCMVDGLRGHQTPEEWAIRFAEWGYGSISFNTPDELAYICSCGQEGCYNPRHYELDFGRPTLRERKVEIHPDYYFKREDGRVETIWGDLLPTIEQSLDYFMEFQRSNYPFVSAKASKLTPVGISQISFHPITGCWESWQYYCKPEDNANWQFDGYGRLWQKMDLTAFDPQTGEIKPHSKRSTVPSHRAVWLASGRSLIEGQVLNHLCAYRRCCNPLHIEQIEPSINIIHGRATQEAIRLLRETSPHNANRVTNLQEIHAAGQKILELYLIKAA